MTLAHTPDDATTRLHIDIEVRPLEFAAAQDAAAWRRSRLVYVLRTIFGVALLAVALLAVAASIEQKSGAITPGMVIGNALTGLALIPWTFFRLTSWLTPLRRYTLVSLTPDGMHTRSDGTRVYTAFDDFPIRVETETLFVLASDERPGIIAIPKRVFSSEPPIEAFRDLVHTPPRQRAITEALHTFDDETSVDAVTFTLTPREVLRARYLMMGRVGRVTLGLAIAASGLYVFHAGSRAGWLVGITAAVVVVFCLLLGTIVGVVRGARKLVPITVDFDEHTVRAHSTQGRVAFRWDAVERLADDDVLFVLVTRNSRLVIPKRALVDAAVDGIRARCTA